MARNLIMNGGDDAAKPGNNADAATPDPAAARSSNPVPQWTSEVLAGAFPAWDLLPATPFLRRVR